MDKKIKVEFNLEKSLKRMEQISTLLEQQEISLDDSIALYKEATELAIRSNDYINSARLMVEEYSKATKLPLQQEEKPKTRKPKQKDAE